MIIGIGCDILRISRVKKVYEKFGEIFVDKIMNDREKTLFINRGKDISMIAKTFSSKESVFKSISKHVHTISFKEIEILRDTDGSPIVNVYGNSLKLLPKNLKIHLTISDEKDYVISYAMSEIN